MSAALPGKFLKTLTPELPFRKAARRALETRLRAVWKLLRLAARCADEDVEHVHQLRVATRRASAALRIFAPALKDRTRKRARRALRRIRDAARAARTADVHAGILREHESEAPAELRPVLEALLRLVNDEREGLQPAIRKAARPRPMRELKEYSARIVRTLREPPTERLPVAGRDRSETVAREGPLAFREGAELLLPGVIDAFRTASAQDLNVYENLHRLRLAGKRLRYTVELFIDCFPAAVRESVHPRLEQIQEQLGKINDYHELVLRIEALLAVLEDPGGSDVLPAEDMPAEFARSGLIELVEHYRERRRRAMLAFRESWPTSELNAVASSLAPPDRDHAGPTRPDAPGPGEQTPTPSDAAPADASGANLFPAVGLRVAAIDVGTNSIRLVVAEPDPGGQYRVLDDERETTRLGSGLYATGRLSLAAMRKAVRAIARMRRIAEAYQVRRLRAVGTSAVREAVNGREFVELVRRRTGVHIDVIDAETEARLAYSSVAGAFDLDRLTAAVVDIGGGSTETVFSSGGVIHEIHSLPLGAVRLSDMYRDPSREPDFRFDEMRKAIQKIVRARIGKPEINPSVIIGTGGTFTTLAKISLRRGIASGGDGRFPFDLRGYEMPDVEVRNILHRLAAMPLRERLGVPGLSSHRAEIIVAGIAIVEALMGHLGVRRLCIHDGGIRDGLLSELIEELGIERSQSESSPGPRSRAVRQFAERHHYEAGHAGQVTRLALQIFDQLSARVPPGSASWATPAGRELLEFGALLHDVGAGISLARHHKHGYDLIVTAELDGFSRRELQILANLARYHRRRAPSSDDDNVACLAHEDQRLLMHLAAILRVADGLDRTHEQRVRSVDVRLTPTVAVFTIEADQPQTENVAAASRKADLFEGVFGLRTRFGQQSRRIRAAGGRS